MSRGGKREGAGAKPGNVNALKHGKFSRRIRNMADQVPEGFILVTPKGGLRLVKKKTAVGL